MRTTLAALALVALTASAEAQSLGVTVQVVEPASFCNVVMATQNDILQCENAQRNAESTFWRMMPVIEPGNPIDANDHNTWMLLMGCAGANTFDDGTVDYVAVVDCAMY